jgi:hypothetical protein
MLSRSVAVRAERRLPEAALHAREGRILFLFYEVHSVINHLVHVRCCALCYVDMQTAKRPTFVVCMPAWASLGMTETKK